MPDLTAARVGQIFVNARDLDRAIAFYRDVLGLRFLFQAPPAMAFFQCGDVRLMLGTAEQPEHDHPASLIYYEVDDIEATHATLVERGVDFVSPPHPVHETATSTLWLGFFEDSEGNTLALMSNVPAA